MAETQSQPQGVIRSTRDYTCAANSPLGSSDDAETLTPPSPISTVSGDDDSPTTSTCRDNPREIRNKAEKQRRDKLNQSISELASIVPPVVAASRKIEKTGILRLTAHYLRAHQYVFGDSINQQLSFQDFTPGCVQTLLSHLNGFLLTTTYRGIVVVVSQNIQRYLGYTELELLGQSVFNIIHEEDRELMKEQLMPKSHFLGPNGELLVPDEPNAKQNIAEMLANDKRRFIIRFKKLSQRTEPNHYVTCHVEGSLRKSDLACRGYNRCCQMVRRARARSDNPCSSGNDVVFVGVVRPTTETFINESGLESFRMEYRTRHSIDGQILQCEQRIALVTGYMTHEVRGVNAMNFMHRDDVRWVIIALREMYDQHRLFGESCYRLMTKNGQFIYMRTRGRLDVEQGTRAVTSFVCTNTVVDEEEGRHLIKMMKKKFTLMVNNNEEPPIEEETKETNDSQVLPVEDPRQLEKVILHLVTNLPSPEAENPRSVSPERADSPSMRLSIIPPRRERIVSAIEKIYSVISPLPKRSGRNYRCEQKSESVIASCPEMTVDVPRPLRNSPPPLAMITTQYKEPSLDTNLPAFSNIYLRRPPSVNIANNFNSDFKALTRSNINTSTGTYTGTASITLTNVVSNTKSDVIFNPNKPTDIKYHAYVSPRGDDKNETDWNTVNFDMTAIQPGVKRPNECKEQEIMSKKKLAGICNSDKDAEQNYDQETAILDNFFDEDLLNTPFSQIDTAIDSLDQTITDPSFPDLLISTDVQDILGEIEGPEGSHPGT